MTEETKAPSAAAAAPVDTAAKDERSTKSFWVGVGIGSAALAAALLYTKRPKATRRS